MGLIDDKAFKDRYTKHKLIIKQWEIDFMAKRGRKPTRVSITYYDIILLSNIIYVDECVDLFLMTIVSC